MLWRQPVLSDLIIYITDRGAHTHTHTQFVDQQITSYAIANGVVPRVSQSNILFTSCVISGGELVDVDPVTFPGTLVAPSHTLLHKSHTLCYSDPPNGRRRYVLELSHLIWKIKSVFRPLTLKNTNTITGRVEVRATYNTETTGAPAAC